MLTLPLASTGERASPRGGVDTIHSIRYRTDRLDHPFPLAYIWGGFFVAAFTQVVSTQLFLGAESGELDAAASICWC
jgi:hypothetical protein